MSYTFKMDESITAVHQTDVPNRQILDIVIHHWGAFGQKITDVVDYLASDNPRQSSAHFVAEEGLVYCIVSPEMVAWDAGDWVENVHSIGIECHPEMTDGDFDTVAQLIAWLWTVYGKTNLRKHSDFIVTDCPGQWAGRMSDLAALANNYYIQFTTNLEDTLTPEQATMLKAIYDAIFNGGTSMPEGKPMKDLIHDDFDTVKSQLADIKAAIPTKPVA